MDTAYESPGSDPLTSVGWSIFEGGRWWCFRDLANRPRRRRTVCSAHPGPDRPAQSGDFATDAECISPAWLFQHRANGKEAYRSADRPYPMRARIGLLSKSLVREHVNTNAGLVERRNCHQLIPSVKGIYSCAANCNEPC